MHEVGNDETRRAQSRVAAGDGCCHHAQQSEDAAKGEQPVLADEGDDGRRILHRTDEAVFSHYPSLFYCQVTGLRLVVEEEHGHRGPDECHNTLSNHGSVEDGTALLLALHAAGHQRALRSMETTYGSTGDGDKQTGEDAPGIECLTGKTLPQLRNVRPFHKQHHQQGSGHEKQRESKQRVETSDDFVDRHQRGYQVIDEDNHNPERVLADTLSDEGRLPHVAQNLCRTEHEDGTHHHQQEY